MSKREGESVCVYMCVRYKIYIFRERERESKINIYKYIIYV